MSEFHLVLRFCVFRTVQPPPTHTHTSPLPTIALCGGTGCQGNRVLYGGTQARVPTVGVAESGSVDVERGILGGEGRCCQGVGGVSEGRRLPRPPTAAGRLIQRDLLVLAEETGSEDGYTAGG